MSGNATATPGYRHCTRCRGAGWRVADRVVGRIVWTYAPPVWVRCECGVLPVHYAQDDADEEG